MGCHGLRWGSLSDHQFGMGKQQFDFVHVTCEIHINIQVEMSSGQLIRETGVMGKIKTVRFDCYIDDIKVMKL